MATILVLQHGGVQTTGRLGATLRDHGFRLDIRRLDRPEGAAATTIPADLDDVHGIVSLGGPQNIDESHWWLQPELDLLKMAHDAELPVIGSCLGHQLLAMALGGSVEKMPEPEIGFHDVSLTVPGQTDTILAGIPWKMPHFFSHGYGVTNLPAGATTLGASERSPHAIYRTGIRSFGFQYHFESDRPMAEAIMMEASSLAEAAGVIHAELTAELNERYDRFAGAADRLCVNLVSYAFPFANLLAV